MKNSGKFRNVLTVWVFAVVLTACDVYTYNDALRDWNKSHEPPPPLSPPAMVSPVPGSTLAGSTETFSWTANGASVEQWWLRIGSSPAGNDLFDSGALSGSASTINATGLPIDGSLVYVRLSWTISGQTGQADYVYTAADEDDPPPPPVGTPYLSSPMYCSVLDGSTQTFAWSANGAVVDEWRLRIGTTPRSRDLFDSGTLAPDILSMDATGLPTDGSLVYVWLSWSIAGQSVSATYIYKSPGSGAVPPPTTTPGIVSPLPCSVLAGSTQTFTWSANGATVDQWLLRVGTTPRGRDLFNSGILAGDVQTIDVNNLPTDGSFVYLRLRWTIAGERSVADYLYIAADQGGPPPPPPQPPPAIVTPVPGSVLSGSTETFTWTGNGATVDEWRLLIGTTPADNDLFNSGPLSPDVLALAVPGLPTDGSPVYVRLRWTIGGTTRRTDYTYTAADLGGPPPPPPPVPPAMVSPVPDSVLSGSTETFAWSGNGAAVDEWRLLIGTTDGGNDLFNSGALAPDVLSLDVPGLPTDGSSVYVRLRWTIGTTIRRANYVYTAALLAGSPSPVFGSGSSETWTGVLAVNCTSSGCHAGTNAAAGLNLEAASSYAELVGIASTQQRDVLRVAAGDPVNSYLMQKLQGTAATGERMPSGVALPGTDIDIIRQWISDGAIDDRAQATGPIRISSLSPMPDALLDASPVQIVAGFDRDLDASTINVNTIVLEASGGDGTFGDGNESQIAATSIYVPISNPRSAVFDLTGTVLVDDTYRIRLRGSGASLIMDLDANALDGEFTGLMPTGNDSAGGDFSALFEVTMP